MRLILETILGTDLGEGLLGVTLITINISDIVRRRSEVVIELLGLGLFIKDNIPVIIPCSLGGFAE